jgi:hypothetical protein
MLADWQDPGIHITAMRVGAAIHGVNSNRTYGRPPEGSSPLGVVNARRPARRKRGFCERITVYADPRAAGSKRRVSSSTVAENP